MGRCASNLCWLRRSCTAAVLSTSLVTMGSSANAQPESPNTQSDLDSCRVHRVTGFPGSHQFASDFIETIASDPTGPDPETMWGLTADLSDAVPYSDRAMYISKSDDRGETWTEVARIDSRYFDAAIFEGLFNGLIVSPGAEYFVVTTQRGAFQVFPRSDPSQPVIKPIVGPRVSNTPPKVPIAKKPGDPLRANVIRMTADGKRLFIGYGYFDLDPKLFSYHNDANGNWVEDGPVPSPPTEMDLLSMDFDDPTNPHPGFLYLGTGDQAFAFNLHTNRWSRIEGVGADSAIHGMSVVGGLHLAACWGVYNPAGPGVERRVTTDSFLLHRTTDEAGSNVRAYSVEVDPQQPSHEAITSLTGVYISQDSGRSWTRINDLPNEEFRTAYFNSDGTLLVSGIAGTFLANPFLETCSPHLKRRHK